MAESPWPGYATWRAQLDEELKRFRALSRAPGGSFLGPDGRLDMDQVDSYFEGQEEPEGLGGRPSWERRVRV